MQVLQLCHQSAACCHNLVVEGVGVHILVAEGVGVHILAAERVGIHILVGVVLQCTAVAQVEDHIQPVEVVHNPAAVGHIPGVDNLAEVGDHIQAVVDLFTLQVNMLSSILNYLVHPTWLFKPYKCSA